MIGSRWLTVNSYVGEKEKLIIMCSHLTIYKHAQLFREHTEHTENTHLVISFPGHGQDGIKKIILKFNEAGDDEILG